jgi:WD40 repeat protein
MKIFFCFFFSTLEVCKEFQEEAYTVSLHPSGLFILVGFSDKLKLFTILIDDLRPFKEFSIRGCREALFSNGGHLFAAVHGNVIQIYSTVTFENITNLKGHNGKVCLRSFQQKNRKKNLFISGSSISLVTG